MNLINKLEPKFTLAGIDLLPTFTIQDICVIDNTLGLRELKEEQKLELDDFIKKKMAELEEINGSTPLIKHNITLIDSTPIKQKYRHRHHAVQKIIYEEVDKMLAAGVIQKSNSAWSTPIVIVKKHDEKPRFCVDSKKLNAVSEKDVYPLPHISSILDQLRGARKAAMQATLFDPNRYY